MATEIPEQAVGANPPPSPAVRDRAIMGSSDKAEASADTSATVSDAKAKGGDSPPPCDFVIGEKVLAWYNEQLYEAKILKVDYGPCWRVHVHYKGWKDTYNEWLLLDKLLKYTEENRKLKAELDLKAKMEKSANSGSKPKIGSGTRGRKRKAEAQMDQPSPSEKITVSSSPAKTSSSGKLIPSSSQSSPPMILPSLSQSSPAEILPTPTEDNTIPIPTPTQDNTILMPSLSNQENINAPSSRPQEKFLYLHIPWPQPLKKIMVEDWACINRSEKLVKLPRSPTVDEILSRYEELRAKKEPRYAVTIGTMMDGLRDYFNQLLPHILLYRSERSQMEEVTANDVAPSSVYGAEHLLRLFVKLPGVLDYSTFEEGVLEEFQQITVDMLKFLQKNQSSFCLPPQQYIEAPATSEKQE